MAFFKISQLGPFLSDYHSPLVPERCGQRGTGKFKPLWLGRPVKLTSYCWNGTIGGYVGTKGTAPTPDGKTYKLTDFRPTDWQMWEQNEAMSFFFNDAGNNPSPSAKRFRCAMRASRISLLSRTPARRICRVERWWVCLAAPLKW